MEKLSESQRASLLDAARRYSLSLPGSPAAEYLASRGLKLDQVSRFGLGYVEHPLPGHEAYRGMLAIPYLRYSALSKLSVASIRFRCIDPSCPHKGMGHGKYSTVEGDTARLYNTGALQGDWDAVGLSEGELDAITATLCGIPTAAVPGATSWKPHWREPFLGFETVCVFADGDPAGLKFATDLAAKLPNARIIPFDPGEDVNSTYVKEGPKALTERTK